MTPPSEAPPFSRPLALGRIKPAWTDIEIEADERERERIALALGLVEVVRLAGRFRHRSDGSRILVRGEVSADIVQTCVVSLDPFPAECREPVDLVFQEADPRRRNDPEVELDPDEDGPEEITGDSIDLGAVATEFLALGLDPYPRRPGVAFEPPNETDDGELSPFRDLARFKPPGGSG